MVAYRKFALTVILRGSPNISKRIESCSTLAFKYFLTIYDLNASKYNAKLRSENGIYLSNFTDYWKWYRWISTFACYRYCPSKQYGEPRRDVKFPIGKPIMSVAYSVLQSVFVQFVLCIDCSWILFSNCIESHLLYATDIFSHFRLYRFNIRSYSSETWHIMW